MPIVQNLNANFIKHHLQCPPGKSSVEFTSKDLPGFFVEVTAVSPGVGSYRLRYKENGKTHYKSIGRTYEIEFSEAKRLAREYKSRLNLGESIKDEPKTTNSSELTYSEFFEQHYKPHILQRKRSHRADIGKYNHRVKQEFGALKLSEIQGHHHIQKFITDLREEGLAPATCDRYLQMIRFSLRLAVDWGYLGKNPADKIPLFNVDNKVENYLSDDEMVRLVTVLKSDENRVVCSLILFLLSTGARLMEAQMARWENISLENRAWRIPATNSKSKRVRSVPLNDMAIEALKENPKDDGYVFKSPRGDGKQPYNNIHKSWYRIRNKAGIPHLRAHDLRHSFASIIVNSGESLLTLMRLLGHSTPIMSARYGHLTTKTLQEASNAAGDAIQAAMDKAASGDGQR
jgi:integrase